MTGCEIVIATGPGRLNDQLSPLEIQHEEMQLPRKQTSIILVCLLLLFDHTGRG